MEISRENASNLCHITTREGIEILGMDVAQREATKHLAFGSFIVWLCSVWKKDVSIVDSFWSLGKGQPLRCL